MALPTYVEFGGGIAKTTDSQSLTGVSGALTGMSVPFTFGIQLQHSSSGLLFSLASQLRYVSGSASGGSSATFATLAPTFRMEFWKFVFGVGYSKWIYRDLAFSKYPAASALVLEGQMLFPITPEIDFGLSAARQAVTPSPSSSLEFTAFFRLNFGYSSDELNKRRKFKGWRYPYGKPIF